jgi:hypothetical protein
MHHSTLATKTPVSLDVAQERSRKAERSNKGKEGGLLSETHKAPREL